MNKIEIFTSGAEYKARVDKLEEALEEATVEKTTFQTEVAHLNQEKTQLLHTVEELRRPQYVKAAHYYVFDCD